jgi:hypothetical protein
MSKTMGYITMAMSAALIGTMATSAEAQVTGVVKGAVGVGAGVTTVMPRMAGQIQGATNATVGGAASGTMKSATHATANGSLNAEANGTGNAGAQPMIMSTTQLRQSVNVATTALLEGISLTARQQASVDAYARSYTQKIQADAEARVEANANTAAIVSAESEEQARAHAQESERAMRERAAEYRARVRGTLTSEERTTFDANVQAGATAEVSAESGASAHTAGEGSAEAGASHQSKSEAKPTAVSKESAKQGSASRPERDGGRQK